MTVVDKEPLEERRASNPREGDDTAALKRALARAEGGRKWLVRLAVLFALALAVFGVLRWRKAHPPVKPAKYITEETSLGDVVESIQSTGVVQPVTKLDIGAQVSGRVLKRYVDFYSTVKKGDLLLEFDPTIFRSNVEADAARVQSAIASAEGAKANAALARVNYERAQLLNKQGLLGEADVISAKGASDAADANLHATQAQQVLAAAALKTSQTNLAYTKVYAPIDGVVLARSVDVGQTVAASFQAPVLFTVAQDLKQMLVFADVDEADLGRLARAKVPAVEVQVEAFPGETFFGVLSEIRYNATTTQGVVTYPAVIKVENSELKLRPGMTARVTIKTALESNVMRVPNAALRFRPTPPIGEGGKPRPVRPEPPPPNGKARLYLLPSSSPDGEPRPMVVEVGISDGQFTVTDGNALPKGTKVIVDESDEGVEKKNQRGLF
ncbi:MAG: efflux RND transporter periplasmic adaptor subunit [Polyangiales bacterium]